MVRSALLDGEGAAASTPQTSQTTVAAKADVAEEPLGAPPPQSLLMAPGRTCSTRGFGLQADLELPKAFGVGVRSISSRQKELTARIQQTWEKAEKGVVAPVHHGRISLAGLVVVQVVRLLALTQQMLPTAMTIGFHSLSCVCGAASVICTFPLFVFGVKGRCTRWHCVGPMVTFVFALTAIDLCSLIAYLFVLHVPRPQAPGYFPLLRRLEADIGVWESMHFASVALQLALFCTSWRVYTMLRRLGLYPPGNDTIVKNKQPLSYVSPLEVCCEAEDVALLPECKPDCKPQHWSTPRTSKFNEDPQDGCDDPGWR